MSKQFSSPAAAFMFILSVLSFIALMGADITVFKLGHIFKIITTFAVFAFGFVGAWMYARSGSGKNEKIKVMRRTITLLFFAYSVIIIDFTLIDDTFGRELSNIFFIDRADMLEYISANTNIVPFSTVKLFIRGYNHQNVTFLAFAENLIGNFCVFMPFAFFLPIICSKLKRFKGFIFTMLVTVMIIEFLQLILLTGSCDIDDVILNMSGAAAAFGLLRLKAVGRFISGITFGVWKNEK